MTEKRFSTVELERDRVGPSVKVHTFDDQVLVSVTSTGCTFNIHLSPLEVKRLETILGKSVKKMTQSEVTA